MARYVFHPGDLPPPMTTVFLKPPFPDRLEAASAAEEPEIVEEYTGPTADELRAEAEAFKQEWEAEKETLKTAARLEADQIVQTARAEADAERVRKDAELEAARENAEKTAAETAARAEQQAKEILENAERKFAADKKAAEDGGRAAGREEGYAVGMAEAERLVARIHLMLERVQDRRQQILDESEQQIVDLALLVARKVVKTLVTAEQKEIVLANIKAALEKVRSRGTVTIKVNLSDIEATTEHKEAFLRLIETTAAGSGEVSLQIHEDSSVDAGGCIVETDFGEIDARVSAQLLEIESRILEISPLKQTKRGL